MNQSDQERDVGKAVQHQASSEGGVGRLRTSLFNLAFYVNFVAQALIFSPVLLLPRRYCWFVMHFWAASSLWLHHRICGVRDEVRHADRLPSGGYLIAAKHQSAWETLKLSTLVPRPTFILKRELMWLPLFGWYLAKLGQIPINRGRPSEALADMIAASKVRIGEGCQIIIFPEGTRTAPGAPADYKSGISFLYSKLKCQCVPIALNSGLFWPRRSMQHWSGTITLEICEPIKPGLKKTEFREILLGRLEPAATQLIERAISKDASLKANLAPDYRRPE